MSYRAVLRQSVEHSIQRAVQDGSLPQTAASAAVHLESPQHIAQGDYATAVALSLASQAHMPPSEVASTLHKILVQDKKVNTLCADVVVVGGYINFYLATISLSSQAEDLLTNNRVVIPDVSSSESVNVEFVSVNPTGQLHIGHARTAFYGDVLARILERCGHKVVREYYINNARKSVQIQELGKTVMGQGSQYAGVYLDEKVQRHQKELSAHKTPEQAGFAMAGIIQKDIQAFLENEAHIFFDVWREEEDLYDADLIDETLQALSDKDAVYEKDGATWLKLKDKGCSQDSVLVRSNGSSTYFLADIAYHRDKHQRGHTSLIDVWGADHQGHIARMKGALSVFDISLVVCISQLVRLKGGEQLSKRKGNIITMSDMLEVIGEDAARYFYLTKSLDAQMEIDLDLAVQSTQQNPVYYLQYTHARICSILNKTSRQDKDYVQKHTVAALDELSPDELVVLRRTLKAGDVLLSINRDYQVHRIATFVLEVARAFNAFYATYPVIEGNVARNGRLVLTMCVGVVIRDLLALMGIATPEKV